MKTLLITLLCPVFICCCGCSREYESPSLEEAFVRLDLSDPDKEIETLEIYIYNKVSPEKESPLSYYKYLSAEEVKELSNAEGTISLNIVATTGNKYLQVVANRKERDEKDRIEIGNWGDFERISSRLCSETPDKWIMAGGIAVDLGIVNEVNITLVKMVSKITLISLKCDFGEGPLKDVEIESPEIYLINVSSEKMMHNGEDPASGGVFINKGDIDPEETSSFLYPQLIDRRLPSPIDRTGIDESISLYCYENLIHAEESTTPITTIVISGIIDGRKYYYPIGINCRDSWNNDHLGVMRNREYLLEITIKSLGATTPGEPVEPGTVILSEETEEWNENGDITITI